MYKLFLIGSEYHCKMVESLLEQDEKIGFTKSINNADLLYAVYGPGINKETLNYWLFSNKPILIHWIGKDTFILDKEREFKNLRLKLSNSIKLLLLKFRNKRNTIKYISSAPWLAKEIEEMTRMKTDYLVLTSIEKETLLEPNKVRKYDFISYIPTNDFNMYYGHQYLDIVKANPDRQFCVVCPDITDINDWPYKKYDNMKIQTRTNKIGFYECLNNSKTFIRLKDGGDAIALSVLEALAHGCQVVWNLKFDHCFFETRESFIQNHKIYFTDDFNINYDAIYYVKKTYDVEIWKDEFKQIIKKLIEK